MSTEFYLIAVLHSTEYDGISCLWAILRLSALGVTSMRDSPVPTDLPTIGGRLSAWLGIGPTHAEVEAVAHDLILRHGVWAHDEAIHLSEVARFIGSARNAKLLPACGRSNKALVRGCVGKHSPKANQRGRPVTDRSGISEVFVNPRVNVRCHGFSLLNEPQRIF
jgi:hypothetical protein